MDTKAIQVGDQVKAITDRVMEYQGMEPWVIWKAGQILNVRGIVQHEGGREFLINLDTGSDWENVPESLIPELFVAA